MQQKPPCMQIQYQSIRTIVIILLLPRTTIALIAKLKTTIPPCYSIPYNSHLISMFLLFLLIIISIKFFFYSLLVSVFCVNVIPKPEG
jgi:hypothetical protein